MKIYAILMIVLILIITGCSKNETKETIQENIQEQIIDRESKLPSDITKVNPETDISPPKSYSSEYNSPVPLPSAINTNGAEDSPFMVPSGDTLYFFFTPDVRIPVEKQVIDGVTGIWVSKKVNGEWQKAERVLLQEPGKAGSDGCEFVQDNKMLFCTVREGYAGINWFSADFINGKWTNWKNANFDPSYEVGELHIYGDELYYHSSRAGGKGGLDIWMLKNINGKWQNPVNVAAVNTEKDEGWPAISPDGNELWIYRDYGLWRSKKSNNEWAEPELMFSPLAGEASLDNQGNVYLTHHFYKDNKMIEADIYVAYKK